MWILTFADRLAKAAQQPSAGDINVMCLADF